MVAAGDRLEAKVSAGATKIVTAAARRAAGLGGARGSRRESGRHRLSIKVRLGPDAPRAGRFWPTVAGWGVDVSAEGLGLLTDKPVAEGAYLYADLSALGEAPCVVPIKVLSCRPLVGATHRVSAAFAA